MRFLLFLSFLISFIFCLSHECRKKERTPASESMVNYDQLNHFDPKIKPLNPENFLKEYYELKEKVEAAEKKDLEEKETMMDRFWKSFNSRIPKDEGKQLNELLKSKAPEQLQGQDLENYKKLQKEFYTSLVENNLKFIESEAKRDPSVKKAAESLQKSISPEMKKEIGSFKFKTKADLLRMHSSLNIDSKWFKSEARVNLSGRETFELFFYKNFEIIFPIQTEFCYQPSSQIFQTKINTNISENLSFNISQNVGSNSQSAYLLQFNTSF